MRVTSPLDAQSRPAGSLIMMGGHMPHEGPVDDWVAPDPWQFAIVCGEQRGGRKHQNSRNSSKAPNPEKYSAPECLAF